MARLVLLSEGLTGRTFELKDEKTSVGRVSDNTFEIPEGSVSSHHAEILLRGKDVVIKDLNSTNGTFINGEKITEAVLKPGQILRLGMVEMRLETGDSAPAASKKPLDHTRVIPQGVKLDELEGTRTPLDFGKSGFEKKSSKGGKIFVTVVVLIGLVLVAALVWVLMSGARGASTP
ncbi:MAG: FHA domain-containing protein [Verrucomicrobia subdivision 3 bacterium]|nr:FHA domain-containing protein [Limisphaerales bacterium]